jgi:uncharacterized membrane protein (DUF485 family)
MNPAMGPGSRNLPDGTESERIAASAQFQELLAKKKVFIIPAFLFFLVYYLLLPVLLGYAPRLMSIQVFGTVTLAYLFSLSQFAVGWIIAGLYLKASAKFDLLVNDLLMKMDDSKGGS